MEQVSRAGARITMLVEKPHGQEHITVPTAVGSALRRNKSICW